jgi:hypothetical protein
MEHRLGLDRSPTSATNLDYMIAWISITTGWLFFLRENHFAIYLYNFPALDPCGLLLLPLNSSLP